MLDDFPKVDLSERKDLDDALNIVKQHALKLVKEHLSKAGHAKDIDAEKTCDEAIDSWIKSAKRRLESNVTINGMSYKEAMDGAEAFDIPLSQRVQHLSEQADTLTAEAIVARKSMPAKQTALAKRRADALDRIGKAQELTRRNVEQNFTQTMEQKSLSEPPKLDRSQDVGQALQAALRDLDTSSVLLLEQTSAAHEQANFVKRLRIMSASYDQ